MTGENSDWAKYSGMSENPQTYLDHVLPTISFSIFSDFQFDFKAATDVKCITVTMLVLNGQWPPTSYLHLCYHFSLQYYCTIIYKIESC